MQRNLLNERGEEEGGNETLKDEIIAINSIYGEDTIQPVIIGNDNKEKDIYILHLPHHEIWLKIQFAPRYPYWSGDDDGEQQQQQQIEDEQNNNNNDDDDDDDDGKSATSLTALSPIRVLGTSGYGPSVRKGDATRICQAFEQLARQLYRPGNVYLFDIIEELMNNDKDKDRCKNYSNSNNSNMTCPPLSPTENELPPNIRTEKPSSSDLFCEKGNSLFTSTPSIAVAASGVENVNYKKGNKKKRQDNDFSTQQQKHHLLQTPKWFISEPIRELKSLFLAHCTCIHSIDDVARFRSLLLEQEDKKKLTSATHNIMAWRIRYLSRNHNDDKKENGNFMVHNRPDNKPKKKSNSKSVPINLNSPSTYSIEEDYDDDGESAAGARLLHLMRLMDIWDVLVIVSRWYGGVNLGPRRFALINSVARDAILKATTSTSNTDL